MRCKRNSRWHRRLSLTFVLGVTAVGSSFAQGPAVNSLPPSIEIIKLKWERQVRLPRNFDPTVIPANGTFSDPASRSSATPSGSGASDPIITFPRTPSRLPVAYCYSLSIRNRGAKVIQGIAWDYLFIDPKLNTELGRHQFLSYTVVPTNKIVKLQGQLRSPPTTVVRISNSGKPDYPKFSESAVIECVLFNDDTVWRNPQARDGICEFLKNERTVVKRRHGPTQRE